MAKTRANKKTIKPENIPKQLLPRICLNMIVKNESKVIIECLESVVGFIDYYVINDTGSTDGTQQIIKQYFDSKGVRGEIINHEFRTCSCHGEEYKKYKWFHFGWNRDYALKQCMGKSQYIFFIDADDYVSGSLSFPKELIADQYYLCIQTDHNIYYRPTLIKNDPQFNWTWKDGIHEYLIGDNIKTTHKLMGEYAINSRRLGSRNDDPFKYHKDAECLEELIKEYPDNYRYLYFYAQSWFDAKDWMKCIEAYEKVIQVEKIADVLYYSRFMIAKAHLRMNSSRELIVNAFLECAKHHTDRAEPLYQLCMYYNAEKEYELAYQYGIKALEIPMPQSMIIYIDKHMYDYRLLDELVFCASETKRYRQALKWCHRLLTENKYPPESRQNIESNIQVLNNLIRQRDKETINDIIKQIDTDKPCMCFYVGPSPFIDKETDQINRDIWGSELALLYLAKEFSKDFNVFIVGEHVPNPIIYTGLFFINNEHLTNSNEWLNQQFEIMVISRYSNYFIEFNSKEIAKKTFFWMHDITFHPYWNGQKLPVSAKHLMKNVDSLVDAYITLSPWHQQFVVSEYGIDNSKVLVIGNGIDEKLCSTIENMNLKRVKNRFIWVSNYDRGLEQLIDNFLPIVKALPGAHIHVYRNNIPEEVKENYKRYPFIVFKGQASNADIIKAMSEAEFWFYPTSWKETYCISALEAQRMGCLCITTDLAALNSTVGYRGVLLRERIYSPEYWKTAFQAIFIFAENQEFAERFRKTAKEWANTQSWKDIYTNSWLKLQSFSKKY